MVPHTIPGCLAHALTPWWLLPAGMMFMGKVLRFYAGSLFERDEVSQPPAPRRTHTAPKAVRLQVKACVWVQGIGGREQRAPARS